MLLSIHNHYRLLRRISDLSLLMSISSRLWKLCFFCILKSHLNLIIKVWNHYWQQLTVDGCCTRVNSPTWHTALARNTPLNPWHLLSITMIKQFKPIMCIWRVLIFITTITRRHLDHLVTIFTCCIFSCTDCRVNEMIMTTKTVAYLSAERAVRVNTDTPTEVSWMKGMTLQPTLPNSHSSDR